MGDDIIKIRAQLREVALAVRGWLPVKRRASECLRSQR